MKKYIFETIENIIVKSMGFNCFLSRKYNILDKLNTLNPDIPDDGSSGFIAYDVLNKDRMKMKTTRFLTRKLNLNSGFLSDRLITEIAEKINSEFFTNNIVVELVNGEKITQYYRKEIGSYSCMTGDCANYTRLYEINPDRFSMLAMFFENDSARAIVSKLDNGRFYLDRIYSSCCFLIDKMIDYAKNRNWLYRDGNEQGFSDVINGIKSELIVSNLTYEDGHIPYMDTFKSGCTCGRGLTISTCGCNDHILENQDGYLSDGYSCSNCGDNISENDTYYAEDEYYCENCYSELFSSCEHCGETVYNENIISVDNGNSYYCRHCVDNGRVDTYYCEDCEEYFSDSVCIEDERWVCESCSESTSYGICEDCSKRFYEENLCEVDGLWYCEDCKPEEEKESDNPIEQITCENYPGQLEIQYSG